MSVCVCVGEKKSDVTPFVIVIIFKSNCKLINCYNYMYLVIKLRNWVTCN